MAIQENAIDTVKNAAKNAIPNLRNASSEQEGGTTKTVENQTAKLPSIFWFGLAVGSMAASAAMIATARRKEYANFVGMWAPCFLLIGIYNKLVKLEGNDRRKANQDAPIATAPFGATLAH